VRLNRRPIIVRDPLHASRPRSKTSDASASGSSPLRPIRERLHELLQEFAGTIVDELALFIEQLVGMSDIGLGLLQDRHIQKHQRLPQMMIGAEGSDRAG
jgi:hypothetical protein